MNRSSFFAVLRPVVLIATLAFILPNCAADDFKPVNPAELAMKDNPAQPGAHAMILEWDDTEDDNQGYEDHYFRMKIFTEEGKKYGDIEIKYFKGFTDIGGIKARVIRPDGSIIPFTGKAFDKMIVKGRGFKYQAKTFTLPEVQPGCIIEYRYRVSWNSNMLLSTHWELQRDLFVKKASFRLNAYSGPGYGSAWMAVGLPPGKKIDRKGSNISLDLEDIPAFDEERYSPPESELKPHVKFYYTEHDDPTPDKYWQRIGKEDTEFSESFIGNNRKGVQQVVESLVAAGDPPAAKLGKIYAYVQKMRNLTFERDKTEQEAKRDKTKDNNNAENVLKNGYGYRRDLNLLFAAMARSAGVEAYPALVSGRDEYFFNQGLPDSNQLDSWVVMAKLNGQERWFDPGTPYTPFGMLRWQRAGVQGLLLQKNNNVFIHTPNPDSKDAVTKRIINLKMSDEGFKADIAVAYYGYAALEQRLDTLENDEQEVKEGLEEEMKQSLPTGSKVKLLKITNAKIVEQPVIVEYEATVPDVTSSVGSRRLVPLALLEMGGGNPFQHETRKHPVYFHYPFQELEMVTLELPDGYTIESLPSTRAEQPPFGYYSTEWKKGGKSITLTRQFAIGGVFFKTEYYPQLRDFYGKVATGDQDNAVLRATATAGK